jgi:hypothetical protein
MIIIFGDLTDFRHKMAIVPMHKTIVMIILVQKLLFLVKIAKGFANFCHDVL